MTRTIHFLALRILSTAALLGTSLMFPATADAQTSGAERALLNYAVATPYAASAGAFWAPAPGIAPTGTGEGERALLGRSEADQTGTPYREPTGADSQENRPPVNGEGALLGKWID